VLETADDSIFASGVVARSAGDGNSAGGGSLTLPPWWAFDAAATAASVTTSIHYVN